MKTRTLTYFLMVVSFGIIVLALDVTIVTSVFAFVGFFGIPQNNNTVNISINEESAIKKLGAEVYDKFCDWRMLYKKTSLIKGQLQEVLSNNPEFDSSAFKSQTKKTEKQLQLWLWPLGAILVDTFLIKDAFTEQLGSAQNSVMPVWLIIAFIATCLLGLEVALASLLDGNNKAHGIDKENKIKYVFIIIVPMIASYSFVNDYVNNEGGYGSIFFFASLTLLSLFTHYIAIRNASDFIALIGYQNVDEKVSKLKKQFEPIAQKAIELENEIDKDMGKLFNYVYDYQQNNTDSRNNFLLLIPGDLRDYFNKMMGYVAMPLPTDYTPGNGWAKSLYEHLSEDRTPKSLITPLPNTPPPAETDDATQPDNREDPRKLHDPLTDFFGADKYI